MTVLRIVDAYLRQHGYDGLHSHDCACKTDDLAPCGEDCSKCEAGYLLPCPADCGEHDWHIGPRTGPGKGKP